MFCERDGGGFIKGLYAKRQPGYAEEELSENHPEVLAFLAPKPADPRVVADEAERAACKADAALLILINQPRAEWATWAGTNFPTLTAPERARIGVICWMLAVAIRRLMRSF